MSKLVNTFGVCGLGLLVAACGPTIDGNCMGGVNLGPVSAKGYNQKCADHQTATTFINSDRAELQVVGATMLRNGSKAVDKAFEDVSSGKGAPAPVTKKTECVVAGITQNKRTGVKTADMNCDLSS